MWEARIFFSSCMAKMVWTSVCEKSGEIDSQEKLESPWLFHYSDPKKALWVKIKFIHFLIFAHGINCSWDDHKLRSACEKFLRSACSPTLAVVFAVVVTAGIFFLSFCSLETTFINRLGIYLSLFGKYSTYGRSKYKYIHKFWCVKTDRHFSASS